MKSNQLRNSRISNLNKGKIKGVGFFEGIKLKISGCIDGRRGLPREEGTGHWTSPHISREIRSYDEYSSRMWGLLQLEEEVAFTHLSQLMDSIVHTRAQLESAKAEFDKYAASEGIVDCSRRQGEGKLTENQIAVRRANERTKRLAPMKSRVDSLQATLIAEIEEFSNTKNKIIEDSNFTRMVCYRVRDHLYQRLAVYWNAALCKHPENKKMPTIPCVEIGFRAEDIYMEAHKTLMQKAERLSNVLLNDVKEVA